MSELVTERPARRAARIQIDAELRCAACGAALTRPSLANPFCADCQERAMPYDARDVYDEIGEGD